jgi:hypothetical protein
MWRTSKYWIETMKWASTSGKRLQLFYQQLLREKQQQQQQRSYFRCHCHCCYPPPQPLPIP